MKKTLALILSLLITVMMCCHATAFADENDDYLLCKIAGDAEYYTAIGRCVGEIQEGITFYISSNEESIVKSGIVFPQNAGTFTEDESGNGAWKWNLSDAKEGEYDISYSLNGRTFKTKLYVYAGSVRGTDTNTASQTSDSKAKKVKPSKISDKNMKAAVKKLKLPSAIGKQTLTATKARKLVGKSPATIAKKVKTVADAYIYLKVARFGYGHELTYTPWYGEWGYDHAGDLQIEDNDFNCCGGMANVISYLLADDYDEIGCIRWIGGGNHCINYVKTGGYYYVFDFTEMCCIGNWYPNKATVTKIKSLKSYFGKWPKTYREDAEEYYKNAGEDVVRGKEPILTMVSFKTNGAPAYPSHWNESTGELVFPKEAEGKIKILYADPELSAVKYEEVESQVPGYNSDISGTKYGY